MKTSDVVIIGGGAAGCLMAIQLFKQNPDFKIIILEKNKNQLARGIAYAKHFTHQPLNVRIKGMSLYADDPDHFENWLTENQTHYPYLEFDRNSFISRSVFGDYLSQEFEKYRLLAKDNWQIISNEAISIDRKEMGFIVKLEDQSIIGAKFVLLATGNFLPRGILSRSEIKADSPNYISNPWREYLYTNIKTDNDVFLIGSGLTAVDIVLGLHARDHKGKIHLLSRNGYLPLPHKEPAKHVFSKPDILLGGNIYKIFSSIRNEIRNLKEEKKDWQDVMDSLRGFTAQVWQNLEEGHKKIFLKRLKPFWEIHRHRIPERSLKLVENLKSSGKLIQHKGAIDKINESEMGINICFTTISGNKEVKTDYLINCTGPDVDFKKQKDKLYNHLFNELQLDTDPFHLGLKIKSDGRLLDTNNELIKNIFCIGSLRKGELWESTALSEIRLQAVDIAKIISKEYIVKK